MLAAALVSEIRVLSSWSEVAISYCTGRDGAHNYGVDADGFRAGLHSRLRLLAALWQASSTFLVAIASDHTAAVRRPPVQGDPLEGIETFSVRHFRTSLYVIREYVTR